MQFGIFNLMGYRERGTPTTQILAEAAEQLVAAAQTPLATARCMCLAIDAATARGDHDAALAIATMATSSSIVGVTRMVSINTRSFSARRTYSETKRPCWRSLYDRRGVGQVFGGVLLHALCDRRNDSIAAFV